MTALLLAPHDDDETLFSFYNLVRHKAHVIVVLRSFVEAQRGGPTFQTRELETDCAMRVAGCTWEQWHYPDDAPDWQKIAERVKAVAAGVDVLIAPAYEEGGHEHHNAVARIAEDARRPLRNAPPDLSGLVRYLTYVRGQGRSTDGAEVEPTLFEREQKRIALLCYQSQIEHEPTRAWFDPEQYGDLREWVAA